MGKPVECTVEKTELQSDRRPGQMVPGIEVTCGKCDHIVTCYGTGSKSVRRAMILLREECPLMEENYYTAPEADGD